MLFYVEGVEDPYNLGSICRTLYAAGCNLLILPKRDWTNAYSTILKASAGAFERLEIAMASEKEIVAYLQEHQIPLYCAYRNNALRWLRLAMKTNCIAIGGSFAAFLVRS